MNGGQAPYNVHNQCLLTYMIESLIFFGKNLCKHKHFEIWPYFGIRIYMNVLILNSQY